MAEEDTLECNSFEKGSTEGKIALDLPFPSSFLSSVSLWKDTEINSAVINVLHPPPRLPLISRAPRVRRGSLKQAKYRFANS